MTTDIETLERAARSLRSVDQNYVAEAIEKFITAYKQELHIPIKDFEDCHKDYHYADLIEELLDQHNAQGGDEK